MKGGRALLCDFDSAKMLRNDLTEEGLEVLGTEGFISPEVCRQILTMPLSKGDSKNIKLLSY